MPLRDLILNNFRWKLGALIMAMFVWFIIQFALSKGYGPNDHPLSDARTRIYPGQEVHILRAPSDQGVFRITPSKVDITVRSTANAVNKLSVEDINVFVNLAGAMDATNLTRVVFVYLPNSLGIDNIKVEPEAVTVERIPSPH